METLFFQVGFVQGSKKIQVFLNVFMMKFVSNWHWERFEYTITLWEKTASPFWRKHVPFQEWNDFIQHVQPCFADARVANLVKGKIRIFKSQWFHWLRTFQVHFIEITLNDFHSVLLSGWKDLNTYCPALSLKDRHFGWFFGGVWTPHLFN